jgi:hypothetical protein
MRRLLAFLLSASAALSQQPATQPASSPASPPAANSGPWLFAGFKNNGADGVYYALSRDGYHWHLIHNSQPINPPTEKGELMRDPFLQRAPDNTFRMVWTWSWGHPAVLGYSSSPDLVHWTPHRQLPVLANEPTAVNAWAPALYWEPGHSRWLIFWSTTIPGRFPGPSPASNHLDHRIFYTTTSDFTSFTPARVYFDPGFSVIDATLLAGRPNTLIFKDERETPLEKHIQTVTGQSVEGPWSTPSAPFTETWSEGPASIALPSGTIVYYDHYRSPQHYAAVFSSNTGDPAWHDVTPQIDFPTGLRHGSFLPITEAEYNRLENLP